MLVSFVVGAITGVGMWFTTIQVSPRTIGLMVHAFHWLWAIEWTFFCLEIASGYLFYRYGPRLPDRGRMTLLVTYSFAAWFSLFWINGILSWQLTPGRWHETHNVWDGFFNPSFWPSLLFRTVTSMTIAALVACVVANILPRLEREDREQIVHRAARFLVPMVLMPLLAVWYFLAIPRRQPLVGAGRQRGDDAVLCLGRRGSSVLVGAYALFGPGAAAALHQRGDGPALVVAGLRGDRGRRVRPRRRAQAVHDPAPALFQLDHRGEVEGAPRARLHDRRSLSAAKCRPVSDSSSSRKGRRSFRNLCSVCHTVDGANGLMHLTGTWSAEQMRLNIAKLQRTKPFMPPFAGNAEEVEALVQWLRWNTHGPAAGLAGASDPAVVCPDRSVARRSGNRVGTGCSLDYVRVRE